MTASHRGPILIELENQDTAKPGVAPPVPDADPQQTSMHQIAALAAPKPSWLVRWFWSLLLILLSFIVSLAAYDYVGDLLLRSPTLGTIVLGLLGAFCIVLAIIVLRELAAFARLRRLESVHLLARTALTHNDLGQARDVITKLNRLYATRDDTAWGRGRLAEQSVDVLDADGLLGLAEKTLLVPLDTVAMREVETAVRQVATVTAIVPLALVDVFTALTANIRMIRRIAEVYGGRSGVLGSWRLARAVFTHLVATGAVAVGDDLISSIVGGGVLSKVSRRFGEGVINGALTARVGVGAIEVCRPLPFYIVKRPSVTGLVRRALIGIFGQS